jgi:hypothetical protein
VRTARRVMPAPLARGWNTRSFEGVAKTERRRIEQGLPTPQVRSDGPIGVMDKQPSTP